MWGLKFKFNHYLGSVNYNMNKNSIFGVHKSEERKNHHGIFLALTSHGMHCVTLKLQIIKNVLILFQNLERSGSSN